MLDINSNIYVAGHRGMVGSAIVRRLKVEGFTNIITRSHAELDLTNQQKVYSFFQNEKIDQVVLAAARVGGIHANSTYPAEFIHQNLVIQANVIHGAYLAGVERLLFLGSSCIYPRECPQPMAEEHLLCGYLEPTNEPYAIAKISGIKMCEAYNRQYGTKYRSLMPTNMYGPGDNYDLENSHVIPALIRKFHLAKLAQQGNTEAIQKDEAVHGPIPAAVKESLGLLPHASQVVIWGTGAARREFLHVDDLADACVFVMNLSDAEYQQGLAFKSSQKNLEPLTLSLTPSFLNVGAGTDQTIGELAKLVKKVVGFEGETIFDPDKPDGTPLKLLDVSRMIRLGWQAGTGLKEGLGLAYEWYLGQVKDKKQ